MGKLELGRGGVGRTCREVVRREGEVRGSWGGEMRWEGIAAPCQNILDRRAWFWALSAWEQVGGGGGGGGWLGELAGVWSVFENFVAVGSLAGLPPRACPGRCSARGCD